MEPNIIHTSRKNTCETYYVNSQESCNFANLSPAEKYYKSIERIQDTCIELKCTNLKVATTKIERKIKPIFEIEKDEISPLIALGSLTGAFGGYALTNTTKEVSHFRSASITTNDSNSFDSKAILGLLSGAFVVGTSTFFAARSYSQFAGNTRKEIMEIFYAISNEKVTKEELLESINQAESSKLKSYFNSIFDFCNPTPTSYLLLAKGIAYDSSEQFKQAQKMYRQALSFKPEKLLQDKIYYALARSLRLEDQDQHSPIKQEGLDTLKLIDQSSPLYRIAEIEKEAWKVKSSEIFDDSGVPFEMLCPIAQDIMTTPVYNTHDEHRSYYEQDEIYAWLSDHDSCPLKRTFLDINSLAIDEEFSTAISIWKELKLKK